MTASEPVHVFEKAGLGRAPFRFVGIERRVGPLRTANADGTETIVGAPGQPMGACQYCYTGIAECCVIQDADGKTFIVGNVCVGKTGDRGLIDRVKKAINRERRDAKHKREHRRIEAAKKTLAERADVRASFAAEPHRAIPSKTALDYIDWMFRNAGNAGQIRVARMIEKRAAGGPA